MEDCQEKRYQEEIFQIYSQLRLFRKYISLYLENYDDENSYERLLLNFYSKNSKL